uniref:NADH dehydrogenase [ubiquinone] 1 beta subcomplex subunit 7 n=1 Tax=Myotis myotis TaxID=51298 RepID=A0A7J7R9I1_MYOMY|nr:NADH:ubiquinone oxidoreductase subunit B7 [Myotis myotis]
MGEHLARHYLGDSSGEPDPLRMPTFPPDYGFPGRKEREMVATQQQMNDAQLVLQQRDYCSLPYPAAQMQAQQLPQLPGLQARAARLGLLRAPRLREANEGV